MKKSALMTIVLAAGMLPVSAGSIDIDVNSRKIDGIIDSKLYGQLFEHIYFSANNGLWQELLFERSFEPEQYPGIAPRDGYFDGWYVDDENIMHSPTRYEQPINVTSVTGSDYEISMDLKWRAYKLANHSWSGGYMDIRFAFKNRENGDPYFFRVHDTFYEGRSATREGVKAPTFSIDAKSEAESQGLGGRSRRPSLSPLVSVDATKGQIEENGAWHNLKIRCQGSSVEVLWDGKSVLKAKDLEKADKNDIVFWVNYTEAYYRNIKVSAIGSDEMLFTGIPKDVQIPAVAQQWTAFGNGTFSLVKDDAVNMRYSQKIVSKKELSGVTQGPQNVVKGEKYIGSIYAKGDGKGRLSVGLKNGDTFVAQQSLGKPNKEWQKYEFTLESAGYSGDADFAICVEGGAVQVDQVTATTASGLALGGFRPDIYNAVKELNPSCMRWPGGGYAAQYNWKWGVGPQEERQRWPNWMWLDYDQNVFGTDEFIQLCRQIKSEPIIVVSVGFERPDADSTDILQNACDWLAYCNEPATGKWGSLRAANGHPEPYNVKYWEIDNEMWEMGIEKYEAAVRRFSKAMRAIDPDIKIIVCGGFREDNDFINRSGNYFDYMSLHHYEQAGGYASGPKNLQTQYLRYADVIAASPNPNIKLFISEWNLNSTDWRTGLFAGGFLNMCEKTPVVELGAAALFIRRTDAPDWNNAFINFDYKDLFVAPNYQVTNLWEDNFSKYRLSYTGETGNLNIVATMMENGSGVTIKVVNPTEGSDTLTVRGDWKGISEAVYQYYAPGSLTAANSMDNKDAIALKEKRIKPSEGTVSIAIDPLSAGVLKIKY
jgi:alpha-L-arabinofuranosidase